MNCATDSQQRWFDWLPEPGQTLEALALGRSGGAICARAQGSFAKVLVRTGVSTIRPVEGEHFTLAVTRRTRDAGFWVLEGSIQSPRLEGSKLRLKPLALFPRESIDAGNGTGDANGRPHYELERIVPSVPGFPDDGPAALEEID